MDYKNFYMNDIFNKKLNPEVPSDLMKIVYSIQSFLKMISFPLKIVLIILAIAIGISLSVSIIRHIVFNKLNSMFNNCFVLISKLKFFLILITVCGKIFWKISLDKLAKRYAGLKIPGQFNYQNTIIKYSPDNNELNLIEKINYLMKLERV